eukprot:362349-Chlamydomonas_euryale.AAC.8
MPCVPPDSRACSLEQLLTNTPARMRVSPQMAAAPAHHSFFGANPYCFFDASPYCFARPLRLLT